MGAAAFFNISLSTGIPTIDCSYAVLGRLIPAFAYTYFTYPEQSKPLGVVPPHRYLPPKGAGSLMTPIFKEVISLLSSSTDITSLSSIIESNLYISPMLYNFRMIEPLHLLLWIYQSDLV